MGCQSSSPDIQREHLLRTRHRTQPPTDYDLENLKISSRITGTPPSKGGAEVPCIGAGLGDFFPSQQNVVEVMMCDFQSQVTKDIATSVRFSLS